jgi:hypothetical protein
MGTYIEQAFIDVDKELSISGTNQTNCILTKGTGSSDFLFNLQTNGAKLTLMNITVMMTNSNRGQNFFMSLIPEESNATISKDVLISFVDCMFISQRTDSFVSESDESSMLNGGCVEINNDLANISFSSCVVKDITTAVYSFIYCYEMNSLNIADCVFMNVSYYNGSGGCFLVETGAKVTLERDSFVDCYAGTYGGAGYVLSATEGVLIKSCTFDKCRSVNISSHVNQTGAFGVCADRHASPVIRCDVFNTSFLHCAANGHISALMCVHTAANCTECAFYDCRAYINVGRGSGAVVFDNCAATVLARCSFVGCVAPQGAAVCYYHTESEVPVSSHSVVGCFFSGNKASGANGGLLFVCFRFFVTFLKQFF